MKTILITGGLGYIGSHTCLELLLFKYKVIIFDSLKNSSLKSLERIKTLASKLNGYDPNKLVFIKGDIRDYKTLQDTFKVAKKNRSKIEAVIHMAGLKSVFDSQKNPDLYRDVNLHGTEILLKTMAENYCFSIIFSSSATVYGNCNNEILTEKNKINPNNNYGQTKADVEKILTQKFQSSNYKWKIINLRYFNPIGAHPSGLIGEESLSKSCNLFPSLCEAVSLNKKFKVFGNDWDTADGTGIRDFIHVVDIAKGHLYALKYIENKKLLNLSINLGSGKGTSILEFINIFQETININLDYIFAERREGDVARYVASNKLAKKLLNWEPNFSLKQMCLHGWKWYISNK